MQILRCSKIKNKKSDWFKIKWELEQKCRILPQLLNILMDGFFRGTSVKMSFKDRARMGKKECGMAADDISIFRWSNTNDWESERSDNSAFALCLGREGWE